MPQHTISELKNRIPGMPETPYNMLMARLTQLEIRLDPAPWAEEVGALRSRVTRIGPESIAIYDGVAEVTKPISDRIQRAAENLKDATLEAAASGTLENLGFTVDSAREMHDGLRVIRDRAKAVVWNIWQLTRPDDDHRLEWIVSESDELGRAIREIQARLKWAHEISTAKASRTGEADARQAVEAKPDVYHPYAWFAAATMEDSQPGLSDARMRGAAIRGAIEGKPPESERSYWLYSVSSVLNYAKWSKWHGRIRAHAERT